MSTKQKSYLLPALLCVSAVVFIMQTYRVLNSLDTLPPGYKTITKVSFSSQSDDLQIRALELEKRELQIKLAEIEMEDKLSVLKEAENRINDLLKKQEAIKQKNLSLIELYSVMPPRDAAEIFNDLDTETVLFLLKNLSPDKASDILMRLNAEKAREVARRIIESQATEP